MGIIVNATEAAQLVGVSERTMRAWLSAGKIPGAHTQQTPGKGPASWVIDTDALGDVEGVTLDEAAMQQIQAQRSGVSAEILARLEAVEAELAILREHSPWLFSRVARSAPNLSELGDTDSLPAVRSPVRQPRAFHVAPSSDGSFPSSVRGRSRWVEEHGGPKASYVRDWPEVLEWTGPEDAVAGVRARRVRGFEQWEPTT